MPDDAPASAKTTAPPKRLLQGRPVGHPLHPVIVHLPIGLWMLSFGLDVIALLNDGDDNLLVRAAFYTLVTGVAFAALAVVTGFADYADLRKDHPARRAAKWHMALNLAAFGVYGANAVLRLPNLDAASLPLVPFVLSCLGVALVSVSGYLGGVMVYDDGVGVGRHRRTHEVDATPTVNAAPDDGFVDVLASADLPAGVPTRVDANGHVTVLVRTAGKVHAVQEFCTHRFGPLSDGALHDGGKIMCPWHRSCFDLQTGKVTGGPAKVDLKCYAVREEDGRIWVAVAAG